MEKYRASVSQNTFFGKVSIQGKQGKDQRKTVPNCAWFKVLWRGILTISALKTMYSQSGTGNIQLSAFPTSLCTFENGPR
jgi:hypothetical protein